MHDLAGLSALARWAGLAALLSAGALLLAGCGTGASAQGDLVTAPTTPGIAGNPGAKQIAPGVPLDPGGDNRTQAFGYEGRWVDRRHAAAALTAYLSARAKGEWEEACSSLSDDLQESLQQVTPRTGHLQRCPAVLDARTDRPDGRALRKASHVHPLSLRVVATRAS